MSPKTTPKAPTISIKVVFLRKGGLDSESEEEELGLLKSWVFKVNLIIRASENENLLKHLYLPGKILLFPISIETAMQL